MRIFAGEWVKNMLTRLGMKEGEAIESRMVSRRIEGAQKKVEERNFEIRKNLLEYDEVMDEQRKRVYGYRQRILDGGNCRDLIIEMIDKQIDDALQTVPRARLRRRVVRRRGRQPAARAARRHAISATSTSTTPSGSPTTRPAAWPSRRCSTRSKRTCPTSEDESEWNWEALANCGQHPLGPQPPRPRPEEDRPRRARRAADRRRPARRSTRSICRRCARYPGARLRRARRPAPGCTTSSASSSTLEEDRELEAGAVHRAGPRAGASPPTTSARPSIPVLAGLYRFTPAAPAARSRASTARSWSSGPSGGSTSS